MWRLSGLHIGRDFTGKCRTREQAARKAVQSTVTVRMMIGMGRLLVMTVHYRTLRLY